MVHFYGTDYPIAHKLHQRGAKVSRSILQGEGEEGGPREAQAYERNTSQLTSNGCEAGVR